MGDIYTSFVPLSIENSYEEAVLAYNNVQIFSPNNPIALFRRATLEYIKKDNDEAKKFISKALEIKPNYTDAIFLLVQIKTDEGSVNEAIKEAQKAGELSPNDPTIFFRLGLLRYNNSDYTGAVGAFERAVILDINYLNARYFLGQSYKKVGRTDDALVQFQILNKILPDNQDIKNAINNISKPSEKVETIPDSATVPLKEDEN